MPELAHSSYSESSSITFEWKLSGLKALFDSTKGDKKSKVTKSVYFGGNRWQILFYANAGQTKDGSDGGGFVSLYLSCEPTAEEKELALGDSGRWVREGVYTFSFELRNLDKGVLYNAKEANNHSFTYKTANWGWAQFARRDHVYYLSPAAKNQDAFLIICTITTSPSPPSTVTTLRQPVPNSLVDTVGALLDDPLYSDVQFIIPRRGKPLSEGRKICASRKLLSRAEYFQAMFSSNFAEGSGIGHESNQTPRVATQDLDEQTHMILDEFEDSDDDDDDEKEQSGDQSERSLSSINLQNFSLHLPDSNTTAESDQDKSDFESVHSADYHGYSGEDSEAQATTPRKFTEEKNFDPKMSIVVQDAAYTTYFAILYYIYTDRIVFSPLSSSFNNASAESVPPAVESSSVVSTPSEGCQVPGSRRSIAIPNPSLSRVEWIKEWMGSHPGRPAPCSAKSVYRIADRLNLPELKERAAEHILKSLTVENIGYEVFSPFAGAFEVIRKAEVDFFLSHWHEIRASETMKNVWVQIRHGRHPGFEEVWPLIARSLEFKPSTSTSASGTAVSESTG
ncbi:hypothetical protein D9613_006079 [Agrocybe pediades]|uniref:MATH domain-containing protein n=1 Tax=Agrocybe pediades TaxID=84607 RepID=A0A8H4QWA8_9AGAR|nr:hypothetical protein D9613_006079 [Agrocybe pediades]